MITEEVLRELMTHSENRPVDFKTEPHRLDNDHFNSEFIKDILAMANTPREESAYIVIGVKILPDGSKEYRGVGIHPDDADLQDKLKLAKVEPRPTFVYQSITLDGKSYGVIELPLVKDGPYFATRDYGVLKANRLYFRRGTKNDEATIQEQGQIYRWFQEHKEEISQEPEAEYITPAWDEFLLACHRFDTHHLYLLIVGPSKESIGKSWQLLGRLPLSLVLDFDPTTETGGIYSFASAELRDNRSMHLLSLEDQYTLVPDKACYWYAAKGLQGRTQSIINDDWRGWNRKYSNAIHKLIEDFARSSGGHPITVIDLWYAPEYVREICSIVDRAFGDYADYVFAIPEAEKLRDLATQFGGEIISIKSEDVLHGIAQTILPSAPEALYAGLPHIDNHFCLIDTPDLLWLSEDLEVLHSNVELEEPKSKRELGKDFLRGAVIGWPDLSGHFDVDREATGKIARQVEQGLKTRTAVRFNLYHWPGAGGTTVARRVAWDLRRRYPTVLLKRVTLGETVGRFRKLFQLTAQSILAIIEGTDTIPDKIDQLYTEVRAEQIPVVFLSVLRRYRIPQGSERSIFLGSNLTLSESHRFAEAYKKFAPNRVNQLQEIVDKSLINERTPFHFALTAFGKNYIGLSKYVSARLETATQAQREIITFLALAYYYGHKAVFPQFFAAHLGQRESRPVQLEKILGELQLELLVKDNDSKWRPAHQLIAREILQIVLSGNSEEKRVWKTSLSTWSLEFIKASCKGTLPTNDELVDLLRRIFVLRDEHDLLGTESAGAPRFAQLIEDIPNPEGQLSIFKELVDIFPYESHFWGHLGRFYSIVMDEPTKALEALNKAIELSSQDPVLHHMKGMCYRKLAYGLIREVDRQQKDFDEQELRETVEKAKEAFDVARSLEPDSEHAHVSPVQLLLRVLDFGFKVSGETSRAEFLISKQSTWYREQLDEIENLLEQVKNLREGERPSRYVVNCQAELEQVYDNYSRALEGWNSLLEMKDVFAPPIRRQIVRAYLSRQKRDWSSLSQKEIERIVDLT